MPQNITDVDTWTDPVTCPANGDLVDGTAELDPAQDLANRTRFLYNRMSGYRVLTLDFNAGTPATEATSNETLDNTGVYVNVASIAGLSLAGSQAGDILIVGANMKIAHTAVGGAAGLGMQLALNGTVIPGARVERASTGIGDEFRFNVHAMKVISSPVSPEAIRLQTYVAGVTAQWQGSWAIWAALLRVFA